MKKFLSVLLSVALVLTMFTGLQLSAANVNNCIELPKLTFDANNTNNIEVTNKWNYISVITKGDDPWFRLDNLYIPPEYEYMAIKYVGASNTKFDANWNYVGCDPGLNFTDSGASAGKDMVADNKWHLAVYHIPDDYTGVGDKAITSVRIAAGSAVDKETRFAYIAFFQTEQDVLNYDQEQSALLELKDMDAPVREEVVPNALDTIPEYGFNFDALEEGYDLYGTSFSQGNPFRKSFTLKAFEGKGSVLVTADKSAEFKGFTQATFDDRWKGAGTISMDLKAGSSGINFSGFYIKTGAEGNTPFYENDGIRLDKDGYCSTGTTGIGFSFRPNNAIEIFIKYYDAGLGKMQMKSIVFKDVVANTAVFHNYKVTDDGQNILFYADNKPFASIRYNGGKLPDSAVYSERYYDLATIGNMKDVADPDYSLISVSDALISTQSSLAIATRAETLYVDNIVLTAYEAPAAEKKVTTDKTTYAPGEPIRVTFENAVRENGDWLAIYAGAESEYGQQGGPVSIQYAYIGQSGEVVFNDLNNTDRVPTLVSEDETWNETDKIFYQQGLTTLPEGTYHVLILGGTGSYNVESNKVVFTVEAPAEPWINYPMANADDKTSQPPNAFVLAKDQYYGVQFNSAVPFKGIEFFQWTPGAGAGKVDFTVSVYKWDHNYDTTVAGEPVAAVTSQSTKDGYITLDFEKEIPAGEYVLVIHVTDQNEESGAGMHIQSGTPLNTETDTYFALSTNATAGSVEGRFAFITLTGKGEESQFIFAKISEPTEPDNPDQPDNPDNPDQPDNPDKPDTPDKPDNPKTGDSGIYAATAALMLLSAGAVLLQKKKNQISD